jgi:prolipoprotein diacylglyceryltransferase
VLGRFGCFSPVAVTASRPIISGVSIFTNPLANSVSGTPLGVRIEPTQLIEAAAEFFNFLLLSWLMGRKKFDGQSLGQFHDPVRIERYFIEFLRDDPGRGEVFGGIMTGTQLISVACGG